MVNTLTLHSDTVITAFMLRPTSVHLRKEEVVFLDVTIYKKNKTITVIRTCNNTCTQKLEPTNTQLAMYYDQEHPDGTGKGITIGEAMRNLTISPR